jgi:isochorismate hydrolase
MPRSRRSAKAGLLIIDMINEYRFDDADKLFPAIEQTATHIAHLKRQMKARSLPVVLVKDNLSQWE